jgi:hypothetical protein
MHWIMDGRIVNHEIADEGAFFQLHRIYLVLSTAQWCATLGYIWASLILWAAAPKYSLSPASDAAGVSSHAAALASETL